MFQMLNISLLFLLIFKFCVGQKEILSGVPGRATSSLENIILDAYINQTNASLLSFNAYKSNLTSTSIESGEIKKSDLEKRTIDEEEENQLKGKLCLENITKCTSGKEDDYRKILQRLTKNIFQFNPQIDLSTTEGISSKCRLQSLQYQNALKEFKLWALKMYDSNAKLSSSLLMGNINLLGDFDTCLSVQSEDLTVKGHYCLTSLQIKTPSSAYIAAIHNLLHSHYAFKSNLADPGHRVPKFSSINWAVCIPHACTPKDVERGFQNTFSNFLTGTNISFELKVDPFMCYLPDSKPLPLPTILTSVLFFTIALIALLATICDYQEYQVHELLLGFSLRKNISSLLSTQRQASDITSVHGIRFINAMLLLGAHKSLAIFFMPYINRTEMTEIFSQQWSVFGRAASLYTDPFIMISGTLTAYSLFTKLAKNKKIDIFQEYISRLIRIVPPLLALILFCTHILPLMNSGPQWNTVVTQHAANCKKYWWRNLLFIHNYFGFKDICLTHTHHVGIDMQLFFISPFIVLLISKSFKIGIALVTSIATVSTIMRYYVTVTQNLSNYIHFGTSIQQLFNTADNMYILPFHRSTVYIIGLLLGYALSQSNKNCFSSFQLLLGNILAATSFYVSFFGASFMGKLNYVYNPIDAAWYAAFAPIFWCASFAWIIFTTHVGQTNILGRIFSWKGFIVATRLSYAIYLTQFPIFFYNVGVTRTPEYYNINKLMDIPEFLWILFFSITLTLLFDLPFQNIKQIMQKRKTTSAPNKILNKDKLK